MTWDFALEIAGFTIGILYLWYEYHANAKVWLVSVIMPMISMWIYFRKGIYADFAINIYYVAIAVYGYVNWTLRGKRKSAHDDSGSVLPITCVPRRTALLCTAATLVIWGAIYLVLEHWTDSQVPITDAFTTAVSIVAMWMMARKYAEQWLLWIAVDAVSIGMYGYKGLYLYATRAAIYAVVAWFGYRKWLRAARDQV